MPHNLPSPGTVEDLTDRLTAYVDTFRPGWHQRIRGASEPEIAELERRSGGGRYPDDWTGSGRPVVLGSEIGVYLAFDLLPADDRVRGHGAGLRRVMGKAGLPAHRRGACA